MSDGPWVDVGELARIPRRGARIVVTEGGAVAVFRTADDEVFALDDRCPHQGGPLSKGLIHGRRVTCPLHGADVCLLTGEATARGRCEGSARVHATRVVDGRVHLALSSAALSPPKSEPS